MNESDKPSQVVQYQGREWKVLGRFKDWLWLGRLDIATWHFTEAYSKDVKPAQDKPAQTEKGPRRA